ncbi:MAG: recombinase family protein [Candidatus Saccharimonadia bacterium]
MQSELSGKNAVAAIRVSTTKQGTDGDSPEAQKEQIERFAQNKGITIKKYFVFMESASKEQQPMQEAVDYCKNAKNGVDLFIIKSIDRFTRGGSLSYDMLKTQLDTSNVQLVDIYGVISSQQVNTLDHLGFEYKWSVYSPSKKSEILEAERSKDELRDIMSRMIGAEIRYTQNGYWMRRPPYGYESEKVDTNQGKRTILKPREDEAVFIRSMFELRAEGLLTDQEIVDKLNDLGYKTRVSYIRNKDDWSRIVSKKGGKQLSVKSMQRTIQNTIYAGINVEKWTGYNAIKCVFDGLVTTDLFNRANRGKKYIAYNTADGEYEVQRQAPKKHLVEKVMNNPEFPYKKFVLCPECKGTLLGSASRGKSGKYYPAYHCSNKGHYFRVPKDQMDEKIAQFIGRIKVNQDQIDLLLDTVRKEFERRQGLSGDDERAIEKRIQTLKSEANAALSKIMLLSNPTAITYLENEIEQIHQKITKLEKEKQQMKNRKPLNIDRILARVRYFLENLDLLLLRQQDPHKKARLFGVLFDELPTYDDLDYGTQKTPLFTGVNSVFRLLATDKSHMVIPRGFEPLLPG